MFINNKIYLCLNDANQPTASSELYKTFRKSETADCLLKWEKTQCWAKSMHHKIHDRWSTIFITISSLSLASWLRSFTIHQKINLTIISGKRVKKSVEKRQHKIKQINYWPVFKETIKVEDKQKNWVELKFTFTKLFCNR